MPLAWLLLPASQCCACMWRSQGGVVPSSSCARQAALISPPAHALLSRGHACCGSRTRSTAAWPAGSVTARPGGSICSVDSPSAGWLLSACASKVLLPPLLPRRTTSMLESWSPPPPLLLPLLLPEKGTNSRRVAFACQSRPCMTSCQWRGTQRFCSPGSSGGSGAAVPASWRLLPSAYRAATAQWLQGGVAEASSSSPLQPSLAACCAFQVKCSDCPCCTCW